MRIRNMRTTEASVYIHTNGGLAGFAGDGDIRRLLDRRSHGDRKAKDALDLFSYQIQLEVQGQLVVRAEASIAVAMDRDASPRELAAGEELTIASGPRRCTYLAIAGGIDAPLVLGGRGALLCAELGRPLRSGDVVRANVAADAGTGARTELRSTTPADDVDASVTTITVIPGPDRDAFERNMIARLVSAPYRVLPSSDRVGTRLEGAALERTAGYRDRPRPMVIGALQIPGDGQPIVLGPEHPTTGGYPIIAVIATAALGRFFTVRLGGWVQFELSLSGVSR
jgi:allophanate hydrolase subunit 2